jgi:ABC-type transport system involved in multi-copper enzyme maturation permease subunit
MKEYLQLFHLNLKLTFSRRYYYFLLGALIWFAMVAFLNYTKEDKRHMKGPDVLNSVLSPAGLVLAIYFGMQLVTSERENRTIEFAFSIPGSRYKVWIMKLVTLNLSILFVMAILAGLSYFFIADLDIAATVAHSMVPLFLFGNLAMMFTVLTKSGNAGGLLTVIVLALSFLAKGSRFWPFLNPLSRPRGADPSYWLKMCVENRVFLLVAAILVCACALRKMDQRERLL